MATCIVCSEALAAGESRRICAGCWGQQTTMLRHSEQWRWLHAAIYYAVLQDDEAFKAAFGRLFAAARPYVGWVDVPVPEALSRRFDAFAAEWHLPRTRGVRDVRDSLQVAARSGSEPVLRPHWLQWSFELDCADSIRPPVLETIPYKPWIGVGGSSSEIRSRIDSMLADARRQMIDQVEAIEGAVRMAGWSRMPTGYQDEGELFRLAYRLYRKTVSGWSWDELARSELPLAGRYSASGLDDRAVQKSVKHLAALLDIEIPLKQRSRGTRVPPA